MIASSPMPTPTSASPNELALLPPALVRTASTLAPPSMRAPSPAPTTADVPEPPMTRTFDDRATAATPEAEAEPAPATPEAATPEAEPAGPTPEATQDEEEAKETPNAKGAPSEAPEARRATLTVSIEAANGGRTTGKNLAAAFAAADEAGEEQGDKKRGREEAEETPETPHSPAKAARAEPDA